MGLIYYHNPRCSKSREGLSLLQKRGAKVLIKEYLKEPLSEKEIHLLSIALGLTPEQMVRSKEAVYKEMQLATKNLTPAQWSKTIVENPVLLERPILLKGKKAVIGRPTEKLLDLL